uniref:Rac GTPase activating protein 1 n=1 Tax=Aquila chrysaetos chrysaetos TaxID=223781 RepID=A0A663F2W7_AQUCH
MPDATVPGKLGCCRGSLAGGKPPHIPAGSWGGLSFGAPSTASSLCRADHSVGGTGYLQEVGALILLPSLQVIRPEPCSVCGSRIRFGKAAVKCRQCQLLLHPKCREQCPSLCTPRPHRHVQSGSRHCPPQGVLADFAPPTPPLVPALVVQCVTEVETRGLTETGLYRVPGAEQLVREWKRRLLRAGGALPALSSVADIHVVCGVLKDFLRGLKEPLVTFRAASPLTLLHGATTDIPDDAACSTALCHVVSKLPPANRDTLAFLMLHLVSRSPDCKMDVLNLSRVFGPTLVGHSSANPTPLAIMEDTPRQSKVRASLGRGVYPGCCQHPHTPSLPAQVVARLLSLPPDFWRGFVGTEQENLVPTPAPGGERGEAWEPWPLPALALWLLKGAFGWAGVQ